MARGCIDILNHQGLSGWVVGDATAPGGNNFVRVCLDGQEIGTVRANLFRPDLRDLGISDGYSGYRFQFAQLPDPYIDHKVEVFDRDSGTPLGPFPATLGALVGNVDQSMLEFDPNLITTHIRSAQFVDGLWRLSVEMISPKPVAFSPTVEQGTILSCTLDAPSSIGPNLIRQSALIDVKAGSGKTISISLAQHFSDLGKYAPVSQIVIPSEIPEYALSAGQENMSRVSGPLVTRDLFAASGVNTAFRINSIVKRHFGKELSQFQNVHDWGIGSGRVALPIKLFVAPRINMSGSDVDIYNVNYGKERHRDIQFNVAPFYPPLPYERGFFDCLYGISVMTHLTEGAQFAWLKELRRIVKPGAPVILTVHGEFGILDTAARDPQVLTSTAARGISDHLYDMNLGPKLDNKKYYRATFHSRKYVKQEWTEHFELLEHYSCANVVVQDFVVLKAK